MFFYQQVNHRVFILVLIAMLAINAHAIDNDNSSPVRVWGDFRSAYATRDFVANDATSENWLNTGTVNASTYLWRPWFALANGGLTLALDESDFSDQEEESNQYIAGNFRFDLFPTSRFPSFLAYDQSREQLDDNQLNRDVKTTKFDFGQRYRSPDGMHQLRAELGNNTNEDMVSRDTEGNRFLFSSNSRIENHSVGTSILFDTVEDRIQGEQTDSYSLAGQHSYRSIENFSIENLVSTSKVENDFIRSATDVETAEISSLLSWRPGDRRDISVTGNLRLSDVVLQQTDNLTTPNDESTRQDIATANLNQGLLYRYSDNLLFRESVNANLTENDDNEVLIATEAVGLSYTADRISTGAGEYGWSLGSTYINEHGDIESSERLNNRFSHSLDNNLLLRDGNQLRTNFTQALGYDRNSSEVNRESISHSFSLTWSESTINNQSVLRFLISDSRTQEEEDELFQLANLQYTGSHRFDRFTRLSGDLTLQWSNTEDDDDKSRSYVTNGQLVFSRARFFQVPRLVFSSRLRLSRQQSESERVISEVNEDDETDESWENSLDYRIGRLSARVDLDFIKADGSYDRVFKVQFTRSFGDL